MNWLNLRTEQLRSPNFANAQPGAIETWLRVLAYCCEQENGGRIQEACKWNDRGWMSACGVTQQERKAAHPLIYDDGVDVFVLAYPLEKEAEVKAKRLAGKIGGERSGRSRASKHIRSSASSTASSTPRTEGEGEGEGNMEREGERPRARNANVPDKSNEVPDEKEALITAINSGVDKSFAEHVWADFEMRGGRDAAGVVVRWLPYIRKRWAREQHEWKNKTHRGKKANSNGDLGHGVKIIRGKPMM